MDKVRKYKFKLPPLEEDERIYINVPYENNHLAKYTRCGYDAEKKLWFTGCHNSNLIFLVNAYSVNKATSDKAMKLLEETLNQRQKEGYNSKVK